MKLSQDFTTKEVHQLVVYVRILIVALGGLFYGYNNGSFNSAQQHVCYMNQWYSDSDMALYAGFITSALPLGCLVGSLIASRFMKMTHSDYRFCLIITDIIGLIGIVEQILDYNLGHFLLGRFLAGIAGGLNTSIVPSYLGSFSPIVMRGKTGTFFQTLAQLGAFIAIALNDIQPIYTKAPSGVSKIQHIEDQIAAQNKFQNQYAWRLTLGLMILVCLFRMFCLMFIYTESTPIQLAQHHQWQSLKQLLNKVYTPERAHKRYVEILQYVHQMKDEDAIVDEPIPDDEKQTKQLMLQLQGANSNTLSNNNNHAEHEHDNEQEMQEILKDDNKQTAVGGEGGHNLLHETHEALALHTQVQLFSGTAAENSNSVHPELVQQAKDEAVKNNTQKSAMRRLILGIVVQTATQLSGLNALMFFSKSIYQAASDNVQTVQMYLYIQGFAGFFFTFISIFFVEKFGRRKILLFSTFLTVIALLGIAIFALLDVFMISFLFIIFYLFAFGIGLGGTTWPFVAELVNKEDVSICSVVRWAWAFAIGISFRFILNAIGISGAFFIFLGCTTACFIYFIKEIKDTKGLSIEQVDELYA